MTRPTRNAIASRESSVIHVSRSSAFGFATIRIENVDAVVAAEPDRIGRCEVRPVLARRLELEGHDPLGAQLDADIRS